MSINQQVIIKELSRNDSEEYLDKFRALEYKNSLGMMSWIFSEDAKYYIWLIDISSIEEEPIGFIGYNLFTLENNEEFIYIMKFFVFREYRKYGNPNSIKLVGKKKVSSMLFERIAKKGKNIITLTSASDELDTYYQDTYGFKYDEDISEKFANIVGIDSDGFLYLDLEKPQRTLESVNESKRLFG